jgi:adenylate cyclase
MAEQMTPEEEWRSLLMGTHPHLQQHKPFRFVPSSPRCKLCAAPFRGPGGMVFRRYGFGPWDKNPNLCGRCFKNMSVQARSCPSSEDGQVGGAEVELSMLFADVRGSSELARQISTREFAKLMQRFYSVSRSVLVEGDAIVEKFIGDEVAALFLPMLTGAEHARRAVEVAEELRRAVGYGSADGPWVRLGIGVHTGVAFVGMVASGGVTDFTALGDPVNLTAHLASVAAAGEILVGADAAAAAGLMDPAYERRRVSLKGHPLDVVVLQPQAAYTPT